MKGFAFKRCGCRDPETGKQLGSLCPKLNRRTHGKWWARYQSPGPRDGRRNQPTLGPFGTEREAEAALAGVVDRINRGTYVEFDRQTFGEYLDQWLSGKVRLKSGTRLSYETHIRLYLKPGLGHLELAALRDHDFEELYAAMRLIGRRPEGQRPSLLLRRLLEARTDTPQAQRPLSAARIRRVHSTVMSALNNAVRRQKLAHNPAQYVELESGKSPRALVWTDERVALWRRTGRRPSPVMVWTPAQTVAFLDAAGTDRLYPLWHLVAHRGLRRSEAVQLRWVDVDLESAQATVHSTPTRRKRGRPRASRGTEPSHWTHSPWPSCEHSGTPKTPSGGCGVGGGSSRAVSSRRRTGPRSTLTLSRSASTAYSRVMTCPPSGCTICGTAPRLLPWRPARTSRLCLTSWATPRSRSPRTSTQASCRRSRRRPRTPLPRSWRAAGRQPTKRILKALLAR